VAPAPLGEGPHLGEPHLRHGVGGGPARHQSASGEALALRPGALLLRSTLREHAVDGSPLAFALAVSGCVETAQGPDTRRVTEIRWLREDRLHVIVTE